MLKNILIKCADMLCRDDIRGSLESASDIDDISSTQTKNDVLRLISYFNYTITNLYEHYFDALITEDFSSDKNNKIYYSHFFHHPLRILSVKSNDHNCFYSSYFDHIEVNSPKTTYSITYKFVPESVTDLTKKIFNPLEINEKIICYGIVSEFFASKSMFVESDYWNNKFLYEIFKSKTSRERRLKSTFEL